MEEIKYKVVKPFTKYDYIVAHQKKYGWTSFKDSCPEFQKDMNKWTNAEALPVEDIKYIRCYSDNFYKHGVMFGFLEKVEPEVNYNDPILADSCGCTFILLKHSKGYDWFNIKDLDRNSYCGWVSIDEVFKNSKSYHNIRNIKIS